MERRNLKGLLPGELAEFFAGIGEPKYRGKQLVRWIYGKGVNDFTLMTDFSQELRKKLEEIAYISTIQILCKQVSKIDGTIKYLFGLEDGQAIESVVLRHSYGISVCVSTQVGCHMGCKFCASGIAGLVRNLTAAEIIDQVLVIQQELRPSQERVNSIVLMGSGEPLANYDQTLKSIRLANLPEGLNIGYRHITLSTCGIVPMIRKLAGEGLPITLSVSLHAPNDQLRSELMPVNRRYPLAKLIDACKEYLHATGRRITFEYALIKGVNDSVQHARELGMLLQGMLCHVNLIPVNPVDEHGLNRTDVTGVRRFQETLAQMKIEVTVRRELGTDIDAACGQLRRRHLNLQEKR